MKSLIVWFAKRSLACLDPEGQAEINTLIEYYLENAKILRETMESIGFVVHGGTDAPYIFVELPESMGGSWDAFSMNLEKAQVVTIPGAGFGPGGEGFLRLSAFAPRESVLEACERLKVALKQHLTPVYRLAMDRKIVVQ